MSPARFTERAWLAVMGLGTGVIGWSLPGGDRFGFIVGVVYVSACVLMFDSMSRMDDPDA
jgi:hypothetical protein